MTTNSQRNLERECLIDILFPDFSVNAKPVYLIFQMGSFLLDAQASLDFTLVSESVSQSVIHSFGFEIDFKCNKLTS